MILTSLKDYLCILKRDTSRNGVIARKCVYESLTGKSVRDCGMLSALAEALGARKPTILLSAKNREKTENDSKLVPFLARLQRKPPVGQNVISPEWQVKAWGFFDSEVISEVVKGHNNVLKVGSVLKLATNFFIWGGGIV